MAYNEEATLESAVMDVYSTLKERGVAFEVIVVNDGSIDRTREISESLARKYPEVKVIHHGKNRGPGSAILTGIVNSRYDIIMFHAADQQLDFREVASFIPLLDEYDLLIGTRKERPGYSIARLISSYTYIFLVHLLFGLREYRDFNFLYLYNRRVFEGMRFDSEGVFLCTEILIKAKRKGFSIKEIEASCLPRRTGKATCGKPKVIIRTFLEMLSFAFKYRFIYRGRI